MKILISGSSGLIGSALADALGAEGHTVGRLLRPGRQLTACDARWDPATGQLDAETMEGADAVVNLAGASIGESRWTEARKKLLRSSRVQATRLLVQRFAKMRQLPRVFISASAVGYYGDRGEEILTESSAPGNDFLAQLACEWETAARRAEALGIRTVLPRFGVVLAAHGGALPRMARLFRLGAGGRIGSGKQWMAWIALDDSTGILREALANHAVSGAVNAVAPNAVRNEEFARTLARVLRRPALFPAPSFALRLALGEMAGALLLSSQRVKPEKLCDLRYSFRYGELEPALRAVLGRTGGAGVRF
jgi:uncharacterized protein